MLSIMQCAEFPDLERMKKTYSIKPIDIDLNLFQFGQEEIEVMTKLKAILNTLPIQSLEYNYLLVMWKGYLYFKITDKTKFVFYIDTLCVLLSYRLGITLDAQFKYINNSEYKKATEFIDQKVDDLFQKEIFLLLNNSNKIINEIFKEDDNIRSTKEYMYLFKATGDISNTKIDLKYISCSWEEFIVNKNIEDWCIWGLWFKDIDYKIFSSFFAYNKIYPDNNLNHRKQKSSNAYFCLSEVIKNLNLFIENNAVYLLDFNKNKKSLKDYIEEEFDYIKQHNLFNAPSENSNKFKNSNQPENLNSLKNTQNKTIYNKYIKSRKKWYRKWNSKEWVISIICIIVVLSMTTFGTTTLGTTTFGTTRKIYLEDNGDRTKVTKITIKESVAPRPEFIVLGL